MKHKVMVVPFMTDSHGRVRFVVVKEARFNEWSFVCGNCRKNEISNPLKTALRELREETLDTLVLSAPLKYIFKYSSMIVEEKELDGKGTDQILFHVFIFNIQGIRPPGVIKNYYTRMKRKYKRSNRDYAETMGIAFMTITDLSKKKLWPFVIKKLINNQYFWEDVAFLRNENFKHQLQHDDKEKRLLSAATPWGSFKCSSGAIGRVELVPRQRPSKFTYQQRFQRYVSKSSRYRHFNTYTTSERDWKRRSPRGDNDTASASLS
jgi:hypothetical protein